MNRSRQHIDRQHIETTLEQAASEPMHAPDPEFVSQLGAKLHRIAIGQEPPPRSARTPARRRLARREPLLVFGLVGAMAMAVFAIVAAIPDSGNGTRVNSTTLTTPTDTATPTDTTSTRGDPSTTANPTTPSTTTATTATPTTIHTALPPVTSPPATHEVTTTLAPIDIQLKVLCTPGIVDTQIAVTCTWLVAGLQAAQITEFHILRGQSGGPGRIFTVPGTANSYVDRPLVTATSYSYLIQAVIWGNVVVQTAAWATTG